MGPDFLPTMLPDAHLAVIKTNLFDTQLDRNEVALAGPGTTRENCPSISETASVEGCAPRVPPSINLGIQLNNPLICHEHDPESAPSQQSC